MTNEPAPPLPLDRRLLLGAAGLAGIAALASRRAEAGPLTPPAGAVASTAKPLGEVEPRVAVNAVNTPGNATVVYRITQPGSYYLAGNLQGVAGKSGIEIAATGVTLDLMGFSIIGTGGTGAQYGITNSSGTIDGLTIRNGTVRGWAANGLELSSPSIDSAVLENIHAIGCGDAGFNTARGIRMLRCTAVDNAGVGIRVGACSLVEACAARGNGSDGIVTAASCVVRDCVCSDNVNYGINLGEDSAAHGCSVRGNNRGIFSANGCLISGCAAGGNDIHGIVAGTGSQVLNCVAHSCGSNGISALNYCLVSGCTCYLNGASGINALVGCVVTGNLCVSNGQNGDGAGVITQGDCRVTRNTCRSNVWGILSITSGSIYAENACVGNNTNWRLPAGNFVAPIVQCPASGEIDGDTGGSGLGSTNPHANFTF